MELRFFFAFVPPVVAGLVSILPADAQQRAIDIEKSTLTVRVERAGVFSALGHDHEIAGPLLGGTVDEAASRMELHMDASKLRVLDPGTSEKDRAEIQETMLGPEVLDVQRYPRIDFHCAHASSTGGGSWTLSGSLTLHGQTHPVTVEARERGGRYTGTARLKQTDFGITPVKIAGGAVRVKDEVRIEFEIQLKPVKRQGG